MAENLHDQGLDIAVVEMANQVMAPLDYSMAAIVHQQLIEKKVDLRLEDGVLRFEETDGGIIVHLKLLYMTLPLPLKYIIITLCYMMI